MPSENAAIHGCPGRAIEVGVVGEDLILEVVLDENNEEEEVLATVIVGRLVQVMGTRTLMLRMAITYVGRVALVASLAVCSRSRASATRRASSRHLASADAIVVGHHDSSQINAVGYWQGAQWQEKDIPLRWLSNGRWDDRR